MSVTTDRLVGAINRVEFRSPVVAAARSAIALASFATVLLTPAFAQFPQTSENPSGMSCGGFRSLSLWCLPGGSESGLMVGKVISLVVFGLVVIGLSPRWTCVPHWYVSFSFASAVPLSNGGDKIAQIVTLLLIPMCLGDDRRWHWQKVGRPLSPAWRGRAFAAHWCLRIQLCVVYVAAAISKLSDPLWRQGSALAIVSRLAHYGVTPSVRDALKPLLTSYWIVAVTGWAVICAQVVIAATLLGPRKIRMIALTLGVVLHLGIAFFMHLVSFGLIMIAVLVIACMPVTKPELDDVAYAEEENRCNA